MGYGTYERSDGRMGGYNVESVCDYPDCTTAIDRGVSYLCGRGPEEDGWSCGGCFCEDHRSYSLIDDVGSLCPDCYKQQELVLYENVEALFAGVQWLLQHLGYGSLEEMPAPPRHSYSGKWELDPFVLIEEVGEWDDADPEYRQRLLQDEVGELYDLVGDLMTFVLDPDARFNIPEYRALLDLRDTMQETANERRWKEQRESTAHV